LQDLTPLSTGSDAYCDAVTVELRVTLARRFTVAAAALALAATAVPLATGALPRTSDYHSLLVSTSDPNTILLGTHQGVFRSTDGGHTWKASGLAGEDAMNLVRAGRTIFMGGHEVFAESTDNGKTWRAMRPTGLPGLDVHGLAVDPRNPKTLYAQIAMTGLYRSTDSAQSFRLVSKDVNGMMDSVAVTPAGHLIVGDQASGIFLSSAGKHWLHAATGAVMGLAVDPRDGNRIIATGRGIGISTDGGHTWAAALSSKLTFGPVAFAPGNPSLVYAVGYDRHLWRSADGGKSWKRVA
jgi:photosystem II stability/assembly factor-like uncharacterized protein